MSKFPDVTLSAENHALGAENHAQVTAYIPKKLHDETKVNLIRQNNKEFSQIVEELLLNWNWQQAEKR